MREEAAQNGSSFLIIGRDGEFGTLTQMAGEVDGKQGVFEYIVDADGLLTHNLFKVNGAVGVFKGIVSQLR